MKPYLSLLLSFTVVALTSPSLAQTTWPRDFPVDTQPVPSEPSSPAPAEGIPVETKPRFTCETEQGLPTVMYHPSSQPSQAYAWATPIELGGGWTPERRCAEISRRLEFYRADGLLELQTGFENGYDTVCVTTRADYRCRIVLTVPPGQNPELIRDRVFQNLAIADSGQSTLPVTTFTEGRSSRNWLDLLGQVTNRDLSGLGRIPAPQPQTPQPRTLSNGIDLRPFLDPADGGTGQHLR